MRGSTGRLVRVRAHAHVRQESSLGGTRAAVHTRSTYLGDVSRDAVDDVHERFQRRGRQPDKLRWPRHPAGGQVARVRENGQAIVDGALVHAVEGDLANVARGGGECAIKRRC